MVVAVAACSAYSLYTAGHDGRPACNNVEHMQKVWPNNLDATRFWACLSVDMPAVIGNCEPEHMFYGPAGSCVHFTKWEWADPIDPPSAIKFD